MVEFDRYVPETWLDRGIAVVVEVSEAVEETVASPLQKARARFAPIAGAAVMAIGVALSNLPYTVESAVADVVQVTEAASSMLYEADDVSASHWSNLMMLLRQTPALAADDMTGDPAPLG